MATCEHCGCTHLPVNLDGTSNLFGELGPDVRDRLQAVVAHPDETTWDDAHSVILRDGSNFGLGLTLWQAVCKVDPLFPQTGPVSRWVEDDSDLGGHSEPVSGWAQIPSAETIRQAISYAARRD